MTAPPHQFRLPTPHNGGMWDFIRAWLRNIRKKWYLAVFWVFYKAIENWLWGTIDTYAESHLRFALVILRPVADNLPWLTTWALIPITFIALLAWTWIKTTHALPPALTSNEQPERHQLVAQALHPLVGNVEPVGPLRLTSGINSNATATIAFAFRNPTRDLVRIEQATLQVTLYMNIFNLPCTGCYPTFQRKDESRARQREIPGYEGPRLPVNLDPLTSASDILGQWDLVFDGFVYVDPTDPYEIERINAELRILFLGYEPSLFQQKIQLSVLWLQSWLTKP